MKFSTLFLCTLFLFACSTSKNTATPAPKDYQISLTRLVLAKPPNGFFSEGAEPKDEFSKYSAWVSKYPQMAEISILSGYFKEGNCEIAIEDANKDGRYDGINQDYIHLLLPKADFSEWRDLYSNSLLLSAVNYFKVNDTYYSLKTVDSNGPALIINKVDTVLMERCMFFQDEVPANQLELQELASKRFFPLNDLLVSSKKQYTVLSFWATYCVGCIHEIPILKEMGDYANVVALCTNANEYDGNINEFIKQKKMIGTHCFSSKKLERLFCQDKLPLLVILDEQGNIVRRAANAEEALVFLKGH